MKKYLTLMFVALLAMAMVLTSCSKSEFGCVTMEEKTMTVHAANAGTDMEFTTGQLIVADGEQLQFESALESGAVQFDFIPASEADEDADPEEIISGDSVLSVAVGAGESFTGAIDPGTYMIKAVVAEKATGDVTINVIAGEEPSAWTPADSSEDAGEKAGVGLFLCDPQGTSLGPVINADYGYMEGVAQGHYGIGAVDVYVHKGLKTVADGDVSFDTETYANEWTLNIDGTEITCFGNREGEATKSIWTTDEYAYSICAYGAGGDDDYGLTEEDFTTIFNDLQ